MKRSILFIVFISVVTVARAQYYETAVGKKMVDGVTQYYNGGAYGAIFKLFNPAMKEALPLDKTTEFLSYTKNKAGNILSRQFVRLEGPYAIYKATFERGTWTIRIAVDEEREQIFGLYIFPYVDPNLPQLERNVTKLMLPFKGEWDVVWGGDTKEQNYHVDYRDLKHAFDMLVKGSSGKSFKTHGWTNPDYYAFGKELLAPCDGEVVLSVDGMKDNKPGTTDPDGKLGNSVIIKTVNNEYLVFAHFKQNSVAVKLGQQVKQGDLLGLCGNSGNSTEPHLHFHITNVQDQAQATGVKVYFDEIYVNGNLKKDRSPVRGDKVRNK